MPFSRAGSIPALSWPLWRPSRPGRSTPARSASGSPPSMSRALPNRWRGTARRTTTAGRSNPIPSISSINWPVFTTSPLPIPRPCRPIRFAAWRASGSPWCSPATAATRFLPAIGATAGTPMKSASGKCCPRACGRGSSAWPVASIPRWTGPPKACGPSRPFRLWHGIPRTPISTASRPWATACGGSSTATGCAAICRTTRPIICSRPSCGTRRPKSPSTRRSMPI